MHVQCSVSGCTGFVTYSPSDPGIVTGFRKFIGTADVLTSSQFKDTVGNIVRDNTNKFNSTDLIYLTCTGDEPHTRAYTIPA